MRSKSSLWTIVLTLVAMAASAAAQGTRAGPDVPREQMWPAPTAEDWAKPVLIKWERTWKDALAVSKETGKPILVCINMDGEIASEHYAGIRYREAEIAPLYEPYVCVIASVYRHNPRDHDDEGNRIECPRFNGVTCGEHIWIEPIIYEKFCDGQRVAPRHICVDLKGSEVYDVFYINDTAGVFDSIRDGRKGLSPPKPPIVRGDRPVAERVASRAVEDRTAVEAAYKKGDQKTRRSLLEAALKNNDAEQLDLLRLAIFGLDVDLSRKARSALTDLNSADAAGLIGEALRVPMDAKEREALIRALKKLGALSPRAQWLAGVHTGLAEGSKAVTVTGWNEAKAGGVYPAPKGFGGYGRIDLIEDSTKVAEEKPDDPVARIELAEASLAVAMKAPQAWATNPRMARLMGNALFEDARRFASEARKLGAPAWRVNTVMALTDYYTGKKESGYRLADKAVQDLPPNEESWSSMAVLTIFAESRWKAIKAAVRERRNWPPQYLADLNAAYTVLLRHPLGTEGQVLWHYELLDWLGARYRATRVLRDGLTRFRSSEQLHAKLRERTLKFRGANALEAAYDKMLEEHKDPARLEPFAGRASVVAAESHRRRRRYDDSLKAYARAIAHHEAAIKADERHKPVAAADAAIALALAGRARVQYQLKQDDAALADILASFERSPSSAGTRDKMGVTPGETAQMLLARLRKNKNEEWAGKLAAALSNLDQNLLRPDIGLTPR